jgi:hypothetical protein
MESGLFCISAGQAGCLVLNWTAFRWDVAQLQGDSEQTAHLQAAFLHPDGCGPRYEPLSRASFVQRVWARLPPA